MSQPTILLVESKSVVRRELTKYLSECGYRIVEASDPDEARSILTSEAPVIDVAFLSVAEPANAAFELKHWARSQLPELEFILVGSAPGALRDAHEFRNKLSISMLPYEGRFVADRIRCVLAEQKRHGELHSREKH